MLHVGGEVITEGGRGLGTVLCERWMNWIIIR